MLLSFSVEKKTYGHSPVYDDKNNDTNQRSRKLYIMHWYYSKVNGWTYFFDISIVECHTIQLHRIIKSDVWLNKMNTMFKKVHDANIMDDDVFYSIDDFNCKKALLYISFRAVWNLESKIPYTKQLTTLLTNMSLIASR